jgi:hypothetical protein
MLVLVLPPFDALAREDPSAIDPETAISSHKPATETNGASNE